MGPDLQLPGCYLLVLPGAGPPRAHRESLNQLAPVVNEFRRETREFVIQLILRLSEKRVARGLNYLGGGVGERKRAKAV